MGYTSGGRNRYHQIIDRKMKRLYYIIFTLFTVLLLGCNKADQTSEDEAVLVPTKPYIYLDAGVSTRASLINGTTLNGNFLVFGYTYDFNNKWDTYRVTAKPNVFATVPQPVEFGDGGYKYSPMKKWEGGKYTFFAVFPSTITTSTADIEGTPYVNYLLDFNNVGQHIDVMTAMFEDTSLSSSPYVYFDFYHRLSAVDVVAMNFYEHSYDDPNAENTVITEQVVIELTKLSLNFENVDYKGAKIYLDRRIPSERAENDSNSNPSYNIFDYGDVYAIPVYYNTNANLTPITSVYNNSIIFIPQESTDLNVTTSISFKKRRPNGQYLMDTDGDYVFNITQTTPFNQPLKEGSRYYLQMTFTSSAVSISIITSDEWDDIKVDYEFE